MVKNSPNIVLILHDIRSCHNVGSLLRTAEGIGVQKVYMSGYTPYPEAADDDRLPHIRRKLTAQIHKTALGAEESQPWQHELGLHKLIRTLRQQGYIIAGLEQATTSVPLNMYHAPEKIALLLGREVEGIDPEILSGLDVVLEIPMFGNKESFNVVQATAMALFQLRFH